MLVYQRVTQKNGEVSSTRSLKRLASKVLMQSMRWNEKNQPTVATSYMTNASCMWGQHNQMPHVGSWHRTKKKQTQFVCVCLLNMLFFAFGFKSVSHDWEPPHCDVFLMAKYMKDFCEEHMTGGLWYWRANYATLATCSEGLLKKGVMNSGIPPPHPKKFVLFWASLGFWCPNLMHFGHVCAPKNQLLDFEVHTKWAKHVQGPVVRSRLSWLVVGKIFSCIFVDGERDERKSTGILPQKYAVIRVLSLKWGILEVLGCEEECTDSNPFGFHDYKTCSYILRMKHQFQVWLVSTVMAPNP